MKKSFVKWLDNYWYHYKTATLIVAFVIVTVIFGSISYFKKGSPAVYISYAGPYSFSVPQRDGARKAFEGLIGGNKLSGGREVSFSSFYYMTNEQIKAAYEEAEKLGEEGFKISDYQMASNLADLDLEFKGGDSLLYLVDPYLYGRYAATDDWVSLRQIFDEFPSEISYDPYSVLLMKTDFGKYYFPFLPEDTILAMRRISSYSVLVGRELEEANKMYKDGIKLFEYILSFKAPEESTIEES